MWKTTGPWRIISLLFIFSIIRASFAQAEVPAMDTLNVIDADGRKQGWWRVIGPVEGKPGYDADKLIEEGNYTNNKRTGLWKRYWPNGNVMSEINYVMGRPRGEYKTYYPSGKVEEHGHWDLDRNTGGFKRFHPNGKPAQEFTFNAYGQRDGEQRYYHENGQLAVKVNIVEGKEEGKLLRYDPDGKVIHEAEFENGRIDKESSQWYRPAPKASDVAADADAPKAPEITHKEKTNSIAFRANGHNTLYDEQMRISQRGEYRNGRLMDGRRYVYDENGLLVKIQVYRNGRYAGDAVITEEDRGH